ncbi:MAG: Ppx/GppA family phosphatase [Calditrichaeota bacterium]|nr:Ppx/GppA family phosphatase [Calditrichota bacterium]
MSPSRYASIDIGTNSVLLLVADLKANRLERVYEAFRVTRLGEGAVTTGRLQPTPMARTLEVLRHYVQKAKELGAEHIVATGTQIFRQVKNADAFLRQVEQELSLSVRILTETEEAVLTFLGALDSCPSPLERVWAIDIGGGSTELIFGNRQQIDFHRSFPVGGVQLKTTFQTGERLDPSTVDRMRQYLAEQLQGLTPTTRQGILLGIGGTITTLAAVDQSLPQYEFEKIDGYALTVERIRELFERFNALSLAEREQLPGMEKGRADIILPATLILLQAMDQLGISRLIVSARGLRYGVILWQVGQVNIQHMVGEHT